MSEPTPTFSRYRKDGFVIPYNANHDPKYYDFLYDAEPPQPKMFVGELPDPDLVNVSAAKRKKADDKSDDKA
jgi:hypothetical protein